MFENGAFLNQVADEFQNETESSESNINDENINDESNVSDESNLNDQSNDNDKTMTNDYNHNHFEDLEASEYNDSLLLVKVSNAELALQETPINRKSSRVKRQPHRLGY